MKLKKVKIELAKQLLQMVRLLVLLRNLEKQKRKVKKKTKKIIKMCRTIPSLYDYEPVFNRDALKVNS